LRLDEGFRAGLADAHHLAGGFHLWMSLSGDLQTSHITRLIARFARVLATGAWAAGDATLEKRKRAVNRAPQRIEEEARATQ
jgi:hypothetical protein